MAYDGSLASKNSGATTSKSGGSSRHTMKKGPWTAAEDAILMEYVKKHGEGNWNAVQRNSGLMRCGKSCRLRWANHLRPNLKKGAFSAEEESLIVELHAKLGNKWARMASQLPGRTDNEIKNYWNTRLKRRQRAGLPIYPLDINPQNHHQQETVPQTNLSSSSLVSLLSSGQNPSYTTPLSIFDMFNSSPGQNQITPSYPSDPSQHFKIVQDKNGLALSLSSINSPFSSSSVSLAFNNQGISSSGPSLPMPSSLQFNCLSFGTDSMPVSCPSLEKNGSISGSDMGIPSIQSLFPTPPTSSGSDYAIATSNIAHDRDENMEGNSRGNRGLLEDLIDESQALKRVDKAKEISLDEDNNSQGKFLWDYKLMEDGGGNGFEEPGLSFDQHNIIMDQQYEDSSPAHSSIRDKTTKSKSDEDNNPVDDDLSSLLANFPSAIPMPEWNDENSNIAKGQASNLTRGDAVDENQPESSHSQVAKTLETTENNWTIGASRWKNLPGFTR
ncbi:hypothetical protein ACH5RR_029169 [Cinchona calisaya]|uniref:Uncharacterized protein n=1 Tax=Cinchona calisaya TaxID=153742 RepID=A0ABD2YS40_9GENT